MLKHIFGKIIEDWLQLLAVTAPWGVEHHQNIL
jgi:hypothetical protein